ncbi:lipoate--protein ligase [Lacrimispora sp. BS-2]|uniref:lipoate--protein ligase n=1 Tax=Lacrimispora sp. BS-2 TaxID=3151850 RepID=A0AAU7PS81_9FIRM
MKKIVISEEFDPCFNIAAEHQLFLSSQEDIHLFLWQNDSSVIIGRNQNLYAECNLGYLREHNVKAVRRFSGGGAVYHDKGNVNFTFITKEASAGQDHFIKLIQSAMQRLGIDCEFSGRNDLLFKDRKFSGHAYYTDGDNYMYHGTVMVNVNFEQLENALTPSKIKLKSKGVESVRSRVINLSEINSEITAQSVIQAFIETFECKNIEYINKNNFQPPLEKILSSDNWMFAQSPKFDVELERNYSFGNMSVYISIADDMIQNVKISTDSLKLYDFKACEKELYQTHYNEQAVWDCIERYLSNHLEFS